jgi:hypothetical protein
MDTDLTYTEQQKVDQLSTMANLPGSNQNKYRTELHGYINELIDNRLGAIEDKQQFTTYTGETIKLCDSCPQHKKGNGWQVTQCNDCQGSNDASK